MDDPLTAPLIDDTELHELGRTLRAAVSHTAPLAWSTDGVTFDFEAPLVHPLSVGGHVEIVTSDGVRFLGHVVSKHAVSRDATTVTIDLSDRGGAAARLGSADVQMRAKVVQGTGRLLAVIGDGTSRPTSPADRFLDASIDAADPDLVASFLARTDESGHLDVGQMPGAPARVLLRAAGFNRHTFLCGQSGSGKTFAVGVLLERLLAETDLRIVVLDPNGDYTRLGAPRAESDVVGPPVLPGRASVAHQLARYAARCGDVVVLRPREVLAGSVGPADPLVLELGHLELDAIGRVLSLDPIADADAYAALVGVHAVGMADGTFTMDEARGLVAGERDPATLALAQRAANLGVARWGLWAREGERSVVDVLRSDARVVVIDLSGFAQRREASTVALAVLDHLWAARNDRRPTLIAIDEAHNVCPAVPADQLQAAAAEQVDRIAAEGRKFGLHLLLATQRPTKVPPNALSQCENLVLMRMNSAGDIEALAETFSFVPPTLLAEARRFGQGETLIAGGIVGEPVLARFDRRLSQEPGSDVPTTWAVASS